MRVRAWLLVPLTPRVIVPGWFRLIAPLTSLGPPGNSEGRLRLRRVYNDLASIRSTSPPCIDPLTSPLAISLQARLIQIAFKKCLGIRLEDVKTEPLGRFGTVDVVLYEFLHRSGCPDYPPSIESLPSFWPRFLEEARFRHIKRSSPKKLQELLHSRAAASTGLGYLWHRAWASAYSIHARRFTAWEMSTVNAFRRRAHNALWRDVMPQVQAAAHERQFQQAVSIAFASHRRAMRTAVQLARTLGALDHDHHTMSYRRFHIRAFKKAVSQLRELFSDISTNLKKEFRHVE